MSLDSHQSPLIDSIFRSDLHEALHDTENKLRNIVENSIDGVVLIDQEGYIVMWNPGQERITGVAAGEALGRQAWELLEALAPARRRGLALRNRLQDRFLAAMKPEENSRYAEWLEIEMERPSGELRIVQQSTFVISIADGLRLGCVFRDVTDVRQAARNLLQRNAELSLVNRINGVLVSSLDPEQVQKTILREVVQMLTVGEASIWLADGVHGGLYCAKSLTQAGEPIPPDRLALWAATAERVASTGRAMPAQQAESAGWVSGPYTPGVETGQPPFACVPLRLRETIVGVLLLVYHGPKRVREADLHTVESIAAASAAALENAVLYQKAQELAIVQERQRLAVTLHEAINQSLFSAGMIAEVLPRMLELDPIQANLSLQDLRTLLRSAVEDLRAVLIELQPSLLGHADFGELLRKMAAGYTGRTATTVAVNIAGTTIFPAKIQEALYHVAREIFSNIAKHAEATQVWVELAHKHGRTALIIRDNGCGFDLDSLRTGSYGLTMIQQEVAKCGASLQIDSQIGQGTEIRISIPG